MTTARSRTPRPGETQEKTVMDDKMRPVGRALVGFAVGLPVENFADRPRVAVVASRGA
jgi:hypothetical protein